MNRKKERKDIIHELPDLCLLTRDQLPKNITYNVEYYGPKHKRRDYFRIEYCDICQSKDKKIFKKCSSKSMTKYSINEKLLSCIELMIEHLTQDIYDNKRKKKLIETKIEEYKKIKKDLIEIIKKEVINNMKTN